MEHGYIAIKGLLNLFHSIKHINLDIVNTCNYSYQYKIIHAYCLTTH